MKSILTIFFTILMGVGMSSCSIGDLQDFLNDVTETKPMGRKYEASLKSSEEVATPPVVSNATGKTMVEVSKDAMSLTYTLSVDMIQNITGAHFHLGARGTNGPVVVGLLPMGANLSGPQKGIIAQGTITKDNLVGPLAGMTIADLEEKMKTGMIYVNVHTTQYPAGETRGQVMASAK